MICINFIQRIKALLRLFRAAVLATALGVIGSNAISLNQPSQRFGVYDFAYYPSGDSRLFPTQTFDDSSSRTYFQFPAGSPIPAFLSPNGTEVYPPRAEGLYIIVDRLPRDFVLRSGSLMARVTHASLLRPQSGGAMAVPPLPTQPTPRPVQVAAAGNVAVGSQMDWTANSYAQPARGDRIEWQDVTGAARVEREVLFKLGEGRLTPEARRALAAQAPALRQAARVEVVGRDDESFKEGLAEMRAKVIREELEKLGIPSRVVTVRTGVQLGEPKLVGKDLLAASTLRWFEAGRPVQQSVGRGPEPSASDEIGKITSALMSGAMSPSAAVAALDRIRSRPAESRGSSEGGATRPAVFDIRGSDQTIDVSLARWAKDAGVTLLWEAAERPPVTGNGRVDAPAFREALVALMSGLQSARYNLRAIRYSNNVVRVVSGDAQ